MDTDLKESIDMIKLAIIGTGRISGAHAGAAKAVQGVQLAGCVDTDPARLEAFTTRYPCPGFASTEEMLANGNVDAVVVALPHGLHADVTIACLHAGKHVLLEKPMAMTVAECDEMIAVAE